MLAKRPTLLQHRPNDSLQRSNRTILVWHGPPLTRYARRLTRINDVYTVMGGFHLSGPLFEPIIGRVCDDLSAMNPRYVVPGHCRGWRAQHTLARNFGEGYVPNCVGTRFAL